MKFRVEVRAPKTLVDLRRMADALEQGLDVAAEQVKTDLERPTATWRTKVQFQVKKIAAGREISTSNEIYGYVSGGTRPHTIRAKPGKRLAFGPSSPKTSPGSLAASAGSRGPADTFRQQVQHPGTDARDFDKTAAGIAEKTFPAQMARAIENGAKA